MADDPTTSSVTLATELTVAWLGNPNTRTSADDVPGFLRSMHEAVERLSTPTASPLAQEERVGGQTYTPAVSVRKSLASPDHIISLIDGKPYKTLRRHLANNGLTPDEYRARYGLKPDYPTVAPAYSERRRAMAKTIGLGRKAGQKVEAAAETAVKKVRKSGKAALAAAKEALGGKD